jgi:hypothetical protein
MEKERKRIKMMVLRCFICALVNGTLERATLLEQTKEGDQLLYQLQLPDEHRTPCPIALRIFELLAILPLAAPLLLFTPHSPQLPLHRLETICCLVQPLQPSQAVGHFPPV